MYSKKKGKHNWLSSCLACRNLTSEITLKHGDDTYESCCSVYSSASANVWREFFCSAFQSIFEPVGEEENE